MLLITIFLDGATRRACGGTNDRFVIGTVDGYRDRLIDESTEVVGDPGGIRLGDALTLD